MRPLRLSLVRQTMPRPTLTLEESRNIETGTWFAKLPAELQADILEHCSLRRLPDGEPLALRGSIAHEWCGVALGAVRVSTVALNGKQVSLTYAEPGTWFGDIALFDGLPRTHDAITHGQTTILIVTKGDFKGLLARHVALYDALLRLNCRRLRLLFDQLEDLHTRPLSARLAKQLLLLARAYGVAEGNEVRIGLHLAQEDLAQLLGASRQRVNQELKQLERDGALRIEPTRLVVTSRERLMTQADS
jgi:CRP/FNR family transcriptional regulator, cyclic AMP receptor protein